MKLFYGVVSGVLIAAFLLFWGLPKRPAEQARRISEETGKADATLSQISFVRMRNGLKDWALTAREAQFFEKDKTAMLKTIVVVMPTGRGDLLTLSGARGRMDIEGKDFSIEGAPVAVQWNNGYTIETASLAWSSDTNAVYTNDPVMISGEGIAVSGTGMWASPDRSEMTLKNVHAEMH